MKKILTTVAFSVIAVVALAQQDAQFSMNMFNRLAVNPGYAGTNQALCGTLFYRQQWNSFPGAPKTGLLSLDYGRILGGGIGLTVDQDQLGFEKTLKAKLAYSYHLALGSAGTLGIGLDVGMIQKSITSNFLAPDGSTTANPGTDAAIPWGGAASTTYDLGFGLYFAGNKGTYVGISALHIPEQQLKQAGTSTAGAWDFNYKVARHYYIMAGHKFPIGSAFSLTPSVLVKSDASSTQMDFNLLAKWRNMVFIGASYRLTDAIPVMAGLEWQLNPKGTLKFGYSYDVTLSAIKNHSNGTHEIMLGYCHKIKGDPKPQGHENVRFF